MLTVSIPIFGSDKNTMETIQLKDYVVHYKQYKILVIDKNTLETHLLDEKYNILGNNISSTGNRLIFTSHKHTTELDIVKKLQKLKQQQVQMIGVIFLLLIITILIVYTYKSRQKRISPSDYPVLEKHNYYDKISTCSGKTLRTHEMDELFDIDKLSYDSRKLKRHRLIQEINKKHPDLIQRVKDKEDQRKYLYIINKKKNTPV
jgi:hypothetical protein